MGGSDIAYALDQHPRAHALQWVCGSSPTVLLAEKLLHVIAAHDDGSERAIVEIAEALGWVTAATGFGCGDQEDSDVLNRMVNHQCRAQEEVSGSYGYVIGPIYASIREALTA